MFWLGFACGLLAWWLLVIVVAALVVWRAGRAREAMARREVADERRRAVAEVERWVNRR
jgi:hypothetical protein